MADSPTSPRTKGLGDRRNVEQYFIRATNLPSALRGWKQFKDFLRSFIVTAPGWVRTFPQHKSADCTIRGREDADAAFDALVNCTFGSPIQAVMWNITDSTAPTLVRRTQSASSPSVCGNSQQQNNHAPSYDYQVAPTTELVQAQGYPYALPILAPAATSVLYPVHAPLINVANYSLQPRVPTIIPMMHAPVSYSTALSSYQLPALETLSIQDRASGYRNERIDTGSAGHSDKEAKVVHISKLHKTTTTSDVNALLRARGIVEYHQVLLLADLSGAFSGVATVMFANVGKAAEAVILLQGHKYKGKYIKVTMHPQTHHHPRAAPLVVNGST